MSEPHLEPHAADPSPAGAVVVEFDPGRRKGNSVAPLVSERRLEPRLYSSQSSPWMRVLVAVVLAFLGAVALGPRLMRADLPTAPALLGTPARGVVKADRDYALVDTAVTMEHRRRAAESALSVWDLDDVGSLRRSQAIHKALLRTAVAIEGYRRGGKDERRESAEELASAVRSHDDVRAVVAGELSELGLEAPPDNEWRALFSILWLAPAAADALATTASHALQEPVVASTGAPLTGTEQIRVRGVRSGEERSVDVNDVNDVKEARLRLEHTIRAVLAELGPVSPVGEWNRSVLIVARWLASQLEVNLTWNAAETEHRRQDAADRVPPVIVRAWRGETVLRPGEVITERHQLLIRAMMLQQEDGLRTRATVGTGFFVALVLSVVYLFGAKRVFQRRLRHRDVFFLGTMLALEILLLVVADAASPWVVASVPWVQPAMLAFALPIACGPMVVRLTLPPDVALLFALVVALLGGVVVEGGMAWAVTTTLGAMTGVAIVSDGARRLTPLLAGLGVGVVGVGAALTLELFRGALSGTALVALLGSCLVGGIGSGIVVFVCVPLVEDVFGYVTDRRLSRLADLNQPLLKDLIVHAPGTWHHSVRVAVLAESGARAVGGNPLLARVMSLYHDIGKISRPLSFRENQTTTENPHDRLTPEESAAILRGHVEEGLALAREHGLPSAVAAVIEEHHGDSVMEAFLAKARARQKDPHRDAVDDDVFRYRGRRPHSKESAIVMLADHIESAARSLKDEPTDARLSELVDDVVNRSVAAGVLTMCDLSLRDLERVRLALKESLGGLLRGESHRERSE